MIRAVEPSLTGRHTRTIGVSHHECLSPNASPTPAQAQLAADSYALGALDGGLDGYGGRAGKRRLGPARHQTHHSDLPGELELRFPLRAVSRRQRHPERIVELAGPDRSL